MDNLTQQYPGPRSDYFQTGSIRVINDRIEGLFRVLTFLALILSPAIVLADPDLSIQMVAEREIAVVENGHEVIKRVPTLQVESGADLYFTLKIENGGDESATNVVVDNPIPEDTLYVEGSAGGTDTEVMFSIDHGETFAVADELKYEFTNFSGTKEMRRAGPDQYTDIRWVISNIDPGKDEELFFKVKVN